MPKHKEILRERSVSDISSPANFSKFNSRAVVAIVPARNEQSTVGQVVRAVKNLVGCDVIVIDDASIDDTARKASAAGAKVLSLSLHLNAWGATQAGLRYALKSGYRLAVTLDSDGQHLAESIHSLLPPIHEGHADVVIGAYPQRGTTARRVAWSFFRTLTGFTYEDLTSGLRAYNLQAIKTLASKHATILDYQDLGVLLLLKKSGLRIKEVPVVMEQREAGKSKIFDSWFTVFRYMVQTIILCLSKFDLKASQQNNTSDED